MKLFNLKGSKKHPLDDILPLPDSKHEELFVASVDLEAGNHRHAIDFESGLWKSNEKCEQFKLFFYPAVSDTYRKSCMLHRFDLSPNMRRLDGATPLSYYSIALHKLWDEASKNAAEYAVSASEFDDFKTQMRTATRLAVRLADRWPSVVELQDEEAMATHTQAVSSLKQAVEAERERIRVWDRQVAVESLQRDDFTVESLTFELDRGRDAAIEAKKVRLEHYQPVDTAKNQAIEGPGR